MTVHRFDHSVNNLGPAWGGPSQAEGVAGLPLQSSGWPGHAAADLDMDPVEAYFECITTCSLDDGDCVTQCVEQLREQS